MIRMKKIMIQVGVMAVMAWLGTAAAHAQEWPKADSPYHCHYERYTEGYTQLIGKGVSLVIFKNVTEPEFWRQQGNLFTVYPNVTTLTKAYELRFNVVTGDSFSYIQDNLRCTLKTYDGGDTLVWSGCSNYIKQWCYQP